MNWIKTSERTPTIGEHVIVHDGLLSGEAIYVGSYSYLRCGEWSWWGGSIPPKHWMPLPNPPKDEDD